ncbi:hypothetical protein D3C80_1968680 [compost metagenome]
MLIFSPDACAFLSNQDRLAKGMFMDFERAFSILAEVLSCKPTETAAFPHEIHT